MRSWMSFSLKLMLAWRDFCQAAVTVVAAYAAFYSTSALTLIAATLACYCLFVRVQLIGATKPRH